MGTAVILLSGIIGFMLGASHARKAFADICSECVSDNDSDKVTGIDIDELIAWIRTDTDNYEYVGPPTTSEIIAKIKEMEGKNDT